MRLVAASLPPWCKPLLAFPRRAWSPYYWPPGTGFLPAETDARKPPQRHCPPAETEKLLEKIARTGRKCGLLACWLHGAGFGGLLGETVDIELAAHHAVIEPVSGAKSGTGIFTAETDAEKQPFYRLRLNLETRRKRKRPYFQRDKCEISERSSIPMTGWWRQ